MSWPRGSLLAALLVLSVPLACADTITVNTTTDDNAVNSLCSLREAVEYVNRDRPKGGFQGCVASAVSDLDSITLPVNTDPYLILNKAIVIQRGLSISGASNNATERTIIKVEGAHRAFVINDAPVFLPPAVSPAGAPWLDPSDAGATGLNLTTTKEPLIMGQLASASVPVSPTMVTVYDVAEDGTKTSVGTTTSFSAGGNWSVQSALSLSPGLHKMVFTTRDATDLTNLGVESTDSPALGLAIYVLIDTREVSLSQIEIIGCVTTLITDCADNVDESALVAGVQTTPSGLTFKNIIANTANNGGIIYLNEALSLNGVTLHEGAAKFGGAIYADAGGSLKVYTSIFRENAATDGGGAFFIKNNSLSVTGSLFTGNTATAGAIVEIGSDDPLQVGGARSLIQNTTIGENAGLALALKKDAVVNVSTIILNSGGIDFSGKSASVYNTILVGNGVNDCLSPGSATISYSLVKTAGTCQGAATFTNNQTIMNAVGTDEQLVVTDDLQPCSTYRYGLLCRLADNGGSSFTYKPRILRSFTGIASDSKNKIINRASQETSSASACPSADQRTKARTLYACDIGAVELQALTAIVLSGGSISYGHTYKQSLSDGLEDEEIFDPSDPSNASVNNCPDSASASPVPPTTTTYSQYARSVSLKIIGCPWVETPPTRGTVVFNQDGTYTYTPNTDFHGFDRFTVRVMTSLSRLNQEIVNQSRLIQVTVIVEPPSGIGSSSVGGALDVWVLLMLGGAGLVLRRRVGKSS